MSSSKKQRHKNPPKKKAKAKSPVFRPVVGVLMERAMSHADKVFFPLLAIAQQGWPFIRMAQGRTDHVRNKMALALLQSDYTHLIMLDIDHVHPQDIVQRLMANFARFPDVKVVGGLNFRRGEPYDPCAFIRGDDGKFYPMSQWPEGLVGVDVVGTGCIAIAREVFELIPPPWFWNDYSKVMEDIWPGEDVGFAQLCHDYGIQQYVDTTVTSPHLIDGVVDRESYDTFLEEKGFETAPLSFVKREGTQTFIKEKKDGIQNTPAPETKAPKA
ncbi:MAG: hypothetical protein ACWGQW_01110 [bacterium]